jgi:biopolymer transport protein ExbD
MLSPLASPRDRLSQPPNEQPRIAGTQRVVTTNEITDSELRAEINVTPLVDVVLVLLVILLVLTPVLTPDLPVELPIAAHADDRRGRDTPTLTVTAVGSVAFEGTPLPSDDLAVRLAAIYAQRPDKTVMLAADRALTYARVVEIMDACRAAGIERIGVVTAPLPMINSKSLPTRRG